MKDGQTPLPLGIKEGCTIILRYAPIAQIRVNFLGRRLRLRVEADDTIADVKAAIQEKEGIRFHHRGYFSKDDNQKIMRLLSTAELSMTVFWNLS